MYSLLGISPLQHWERANSINVKTTTQYEKDTHAHAACEGLFDTMGVNIFTQLKSISWPSK